MPTISEQSSEIQPHPRSSRKSVRDWLYTSNPFYAISTALVTVGFRLWTDPLPLDDALWWLLGGLSLFIVILAGVCVALVRIGRVWEDTRTLFFLLDLLFYFLSASLDRPLQENFSSAQGLPWFGLGFSICISELVLKGTGIHLGVLPRICHHLCLAITFLSPLYLAGSIDESSLYRATSLQVLTTLWPLCFLLMLPSCRRPGARGAEPWKWPMVPLAPFVFLLIISIGRSYLLAIPFGPGTQYDVVLASTQLAPCLWVVGILCLNLRVDHSWISNLGRTLPWVAFILIALHEPNNRFQIELLEGITQHLASPLFLSLGYLVTHNVILSLRRSKHSNEVSVSLFLAIFIGPMTHGFDQSLSYDWTATLPFLLWSLYQSYQKKSSLHALILSIGSLFIITTELESIVSDDARIDVFLHGCLLLMLIVSATFRDRTAQKLKSIVLLLTIGMICLRTLPDWKVEYPTLMKHVYLASMTSILVIWSYAIKNRSAFFASFFGIIWQIGFTAIQVFDNTSFQDRSKGPLLLLAGILSLLIGMLISLRKMKIITLEASDWAKILPPLHSGPEPNPLSGNRLLKSFWGILGILFLSALFLPSLTHHHGDTSEMIVHKSELRNIGQSMLAHSVADKNETFRSDILELIRKKEPDLLGNPNIVFHPDLSNVKKGDHRHPLAYLWIKEKQWGCLLFSDCHLENIFETPDDQIWKIREDHE